MRDFERMISEGREALHAHPHYDMSCHEMLTELTNASEVNAMFEAVRRAYDAGVCAGLRIAKRRVETAR
jgi:hypothetical protein